MIKDGSNPQNEGKVFLYRYGKKIFDKLNECMNPEFEDETPINPFDFWEGADFKLKVRTLDGFVNYDKSEFDSPSALFDGDEGALEKVYNQQHSLSELISPDNFKTYSELKQQLDRALGVKEVQEVLEETPWQETKVEEPQIQNSTEVSNGGDTSEELSYFKKLAAESL